MPKRGTAGRKAAKPGAPRKRAARGKAAPVEVNDQERRHLVDDIAYFHAERYRPVAPGGCRDEDRAQAEAEIEAVLRRRRKR